MEEVEATMVSNMRDGIKEGEEETMATVDEDIASATTKLGKPEKKGIKSANM